MKTRPTTSERETRATDRTKDFLQHRKQDAPAMLAETGVGEANTKGKL